jgi:hypothetical protein
LVSGYPPGESLYQGFGWPADAGHHAFYDHRIGWQAFSK